MSEIAELGEFGLIRHLTEDIELKNESSRKGVGDDCAVLAPQAGMHTLVTTDMLMEGVHFDLTYVPMHYLGYKAVIENLSDIYAMNGRPRQITVSLALSKRFSVEDIDQLWAEAKALYDAHVETVVLTPALAQQALDIQEQYLQDDPRAARIREYLDRLLPENWNTMSISDRQDWLATDEQGTVRRTRVCAAEIWCEALGNSGTERMRHFDAVEINQILDSLPEWSRVRSNIRFPIYGAAKAFVRS